MGRGGGGERGIVVMRNVTLQRLVSMERERVCGM